MSLSKRTRANRANAKKSTGPITIEGKRRSSRNSATHGLTMRILPDSLQPPDGQSPEFQALLDLYVADHQPGNQSEFDLLRTLASQQWQLRRADAYIENFSRDLFARDPLEVSRILENFTRQQARVQRAYNQTLTLFHNLKRERLATQQAQLDNATRIYKHLIDQKDPDLESWDPKDDGFDFPVDAVKANLKQWNLEQRANRDFIAPKFIITMTDMHTGIVYGSNDPSRTTPRADQVRIITEYQERLRKDTPAAETENGNSVNGNH